MDLNQLLSAHQIALMDEAEADDRAHAAAYGDTVAALAVRIRSLREDGGADVDAARFVAGEPEGDYFER
jgi:hypothetical protein